jgi:ABC-type lipoprotein release transport system permease subunit
MRVMSSLLFQVSPVDPLTYALVALTLVSATVLASYVPALRATMLDPVEALRAE